MLAEPVWSQLSFKPMEVPLSPISGKKIEIIVKKSEIFRSKFSISKAPIQNIPDSPCGMTYIVAISSSSTIEI